MQNRVTERSKLITLFTLNFLRDNTIFKAYFKTTTLACKIKKKRQTFSCIVTERTKLITASDHPFKMSACLRGGGVSPYADGQKVTVHKDQKSPS